jgi:thioredoxin reductase (NADPH)
MSEPEAKSAYYDVVVVGAGPAGMSAAINVANRKKTVLVLDGQAPFAKARKAHQIPNYPGFSFASGEQLAEAFLRHLEEFDVTLLREKVSRIFRDEDQLIVCSEKDNYHARAVILATGVYREAELEGEEALVGQGVSYCVSCDGRLFAGREVAFVSFQPEGEEEATAMAEDFGARVTFIPLYRGEYQLPESVRVLPRKRPDRLYRQDGKVHVVLPDEEVVVDAVFVIKPGVSPRTLIEGLEMDDRHILVNRDMETGLPGVYAAGDATAEPYQIAKAVGEGQVAALQAVRFISEKSRARREQREPSLKPEDRENLTRILRERMIAPVHLLHFTQEPRDGGWSGPACQECREARQLLEEFAGLSTKLELEVRDYLADEEHARRLGVLRLPATLLSSPGDEYPRVRFYGTPSGYEFGVLLEDILQLSAGDKQLQAETVARLTRLEREVHLEVLATPTCPVCPAAVRLAHRFALASTRVRADLIMVSEYPELAQRYDVRSVPMLIVNGKPAPEGRLDEERLLELVTSAGSSPG